MKQNEKLKWIAIALIIEGLFIGIDFSQYGIPSIYLFGYHVHHWLIGVIILYIALR